MTPSTKKIRQAPDILITADAAADRRRRQNGVIRRANVGPKHKHKMLRQFITRCQHVLCLHCAPRLPHQLHSLSPLILTKTCSFFLCLSHTHSTSHAQPKKSIRHVSVNSQCPARHLISEHRNSHLSRALPHSPSSSLSTSPSLTQPSTLSLPLSPTLLPFSLSPSLCAPSISLFLCLQRTNVPCVVCTAARCRILTCATPR